MFKHVHTVTTIETLSQTIESLQTNKAVETFLIDTFFIDGEFDGLTKVTVCFGEITNIEMVFPQPEHHEIIIRERQLLTELKPELNQNLSTNDIQKLNNGVSLPF